MVRWQIGSKHPWKNIAKVLVGRRIAIALSHLFVKIFCQLFSCLQRQPISNISKICNLDKFRLEELDIHSHGVKVENIRAISGVFFNSVFQSVLNMDKNSIRNVKNHQIVITNKNTPQNCISPLKQGEVYSNDKRLKALELSLNDYQNWKLPSNWT